MYTNKDTARHIANLARSLLEANTNLTKANDSYNMITVVQAMKLATQIVASENIAEQLSKIANSLKT